MAWLLLAALAGAGCAATPATPTPAANSPTPTAAAAETAARPTATAEIPPTATAKPLPTATAATPPTATAETPTAAATLPPVDPTATPTAEPNAPGLPPAPDFAFTLIQGGERLGGDMLHLSQLAGRPLVLNFWARYCPPCWSEMPQLQRFYEDYGGAVELLGLDIGEYTGLGGRKDSSGLLASLQVTYPAGFTDHRGIVADYGVRAMPTTIFITADGKVFTAWSGAISYEMTAEIVQEMLAWESQTGETPAGANQTGETPAGEIPAGERRPGE